MLKKFIIRNSLFGIHCLKMYIEIRYNEQIGCYFFNEFLKEKRFNICVYISLSFVLHFMPLFLVTSPCPRSLIDGILYQATKSPLIWNVKSSNKNLFCFCCLLCCYYNEIETSIQA